jgi:cytochrome c-type biogenesis protein CcmH
MIVFWLVCATLIAIALAFILPPLLQSSARDTDKQDKEANVNVYRDQLSELEADLRNGIISQEQYQQDRDELERRLLDDVSASEPTAGTKPKQLRTGRASVYALALGIPLVAVSIYLRVGDLAAVSGRTAPAAQGPFSQSATGNGEMTPQVIEANVAALAKRLEQNPGDAEGWAMLGRSYSNMERFSDARDAFARATALKPDDADLWADYAFAMAMANGRQIQGQPLEIINKALKLDPGNLKALELAGTAEFQAKHYEQAIDYWQKILVKTPPNSELAQALTQRINEAKSLSGTGGSKD